MSKKKKIPPKNPSPLTQYRTGCPPKMEKEKLDNIPKWVRAVFNAI
jgi:hypothetical protein